MRFTGVQSYGLNGFRVLWAISISRKNRAASRTEIKSRHRTGDRNWCARDKRDDAAEHRRGVRDPGVASQRARHRCDHDENQRKDLRHENDRAPNRSHAWLPRFSKRSPPAQ
jgi:hypothetical protein